MDGEIILDRREHNIMKLDDSEQALMNEIEIEVPRHQPVKKQVARMKTQFTPPVRQVFQEDMDSFANPNKQTQPSAPPQEVLITVNTTITDLKWITEWETVVGVDILWTKMKINLPRDLKL